MLKVLLIAVDKLKRFFWSRSDITFIVSIEVNNGLLFAFLNLKALWIKSFVFQLIFVDLIGLFGRALPHPTNHFHFELNYALFKVFK